MTLRWKAILALAAGLGGCAGEVVRHPVEWQAAAVPQKARYVAARTTTFTLDSGYARTIREGTEFVDAGRIRQGTIFKPVNNVFSIEGAHSHEAYPVVDGERIVGFFLPVERAFSPLSQFVPFALEERKP